MYSLLQIVVEHYSENSMYYFVQKKSESLYWIPTPLGVGPDLARGPAVGHCWFRNIKPAWATKKLVATA
jgi:hypothetical protein